MKLPACALALFLIAPVVFADDRSTDYDQKTDFSKFKTFSISQGQVTAKAPELKGRLVRKKIEEAIRTQLTAKGLREVPNRFDLVVTYRFGAADRRQVQSWPVGRWGKARRFDNYKFTEGTFVGCFPARDSPGLVLRGVYPDDETNPSKISDKLPDHIKKLFTKYPPKTKKS